MTFIPGDNTALTTSRCLLMTLRDYPAQYITSLLNNLRSQHTHLIHTGKLVGDPNTDHPQSPITHALQNLARTLNIPPVSTPLPIRALPPPRNMPGIREQQLSAHAQLPKLQNQGPHACVNTVTSLSMFSHNHL